MAVLRKSISSPRPPQEYTPERAAEDCRTIAKQKQIVLQPLDVFGLAVALGLFVIKAPLGENISGFFRRGTLGFEVGVNSLHHPNRQRFTLAHEIGHYMLHRNHGAFEDGLLFRRNQTNTQEIEANIFASALLMPRFEFDRSLKSMTIEEIAIAFGVSKQAAEFRLRNLGHVSG